MGVDWDDDPSEQRRERIMQKLKEEGVSDDDASTKCAEIMSEMEDEESKGYVCDGDYYNKPYLNKY
jgi:hypothetical protein